MSAPIDTKEARERLNKGWAYEDSGWAESMVESLCAELDVLKAENARLRADGERMRAEIQRMRNEPPAPF